MLFDGQEYKMEASLTERQKEFLAAYRETKATAKAATVLGVAEDTARTQLRNIARKLGFTCIKQIIATELDQGQKKATASELMGLLKKQEFKCALSGRKLKPDGSQLDHVFPKSKGGSDDVSNLQWVTTKINRMKGSMSNEEFINVCGEVWRNALSTRGPLPPIG